MFKAFRNACRAVGLAARADAALNPLWQSAPREPRAVWDLFIGGAPTWRALLSGLPGVRVTYEAVFCHQRPIVTFPGGRCELADALIDIEYTRPHARRHALLLQAKMDATTPSGAQRLLYTYWPTFTYTMGSHRPPPRKFPFPTAMSRASYLNLDRATKAASVAKPGARGVSLGTAVADIVGGRVAAVYANDPNGPANSDWSKTIWDLKTWTASQPVPPRALGLPAPSPRGTYRMMVAPPPGPPQDSGPPPELDEGFAMVTLTVDPGPDDDRTQWVERPLRG